jgi:hypothetical protein
MEDLLKYVPTPRDLFNPPPQARVFNNQIQIEELAEAVQQVYPDGYDERQQILLRVLEIIREHDERVFEGVR